jgi:Plasmid pRiA4b ORF-3-like protein
MPSSDAPAPIYQLKITLSGITPPIWRRIQVSGSMKLCCFHRTLQVVMGWADSHLHQFEKDGKNWGVPEWHESDRFDLIDESKTLLAKVLKAEGDSMTYQYDFGNDWRHEVVLTRIIPMGDVVKIPICYGGQRHCPLEGMGGVSGYKAFLETIFDSSSWDDFDLRAVNETLSRMRWPCDTLRHVET